MQLQGLLLILFMLFIVPIIILFTNPNVFFIIVSVILFFLSLRNIHIILFNINEPYEEQDDELIEYLEFTLNIDIRKFGKGLKVVIDLIFILFFIYCIYYINSIWLKSICGLIILYWYIDIIWVSNKNIDSVVKVSNAYLKNTFIILVNSITILLITVVIYNKFMKGVI